MYNISIIFLIFLLFNTTTLGSSDEVVLDIEEIQRPRFLKYEDDDGVIHTVDTRPPVSTRKSSNFGRSYKEVKLPPDSVKFLLYTRRNHSTPQSLPFGERERLETSHFNPKDPTIVIIHGWWGHPEKGPNPVIKNAYFNVMDANVIVVDWKIVAMHEYFRVISQVPNVAETLARFLDFLIEETEASFNDIHLIGFSLGAHIAGHAGRSLKKGIVARITALDPAGPFWEKNPYHLRDTDARYVEAIHTDVFGFGTLNTWGATNFYPNGGGHQPGCFILYIGCSHSRAFHLFASTVESNYLIARKCESLAQMQSGNCEGEEMSMGNSDLSKFGNGIYRLETGSTAPFSH